MLSTLVCRCSSTRALRMSQSSCEICAAGDFDSSAGTCPPLAGPVDAKAWLPAGMPAAVLAVIAAPLFGPDLRAAAVRRADAACVAALELRRDRRLGDRAPAGRRRSPAGGGLLERTVGRGDHRIRPQAVPPRAAGRRRLPAGGAGLRRRLTPPAPRCSPGPYFHTVPSGLVSPAAPLQPEDMPPRAREPAGVALVDKPAGPSSFAIVAALRRRTRARTGHAGTLD